MIIEKIKIGGFGKFRDFELSLQDGLQVIYGRNESGKSTIMDFIMLMFYSRLSGEKAGKRDKEFRQKYLPWDGGKMFGTLEFVHDGERYILTKEFHTDTPSKDKIIIRNLSVGEDVALGQKVEVGEWIFGLDLRGFERSGFIKDVGTDVFNNTSNKKDSLSDRIFNIVTGQEKESISERLITKKLDDAIKDIVKNKGRIDVLEGQIYEIKSKIFKLNQQVLQQEEYKSRLEVLKKRIESKRELKDKLEYCTLLEKLSDLRETKLYLQNIENIKESIVNKKITYEEFLVFFEKIKEIKSKIDCKEKVLGEFKSLDDDVCEVCDESIKVFQKAKARIQKLKDTVFYINSVGLEKLEYSKKQKDDIYNRIQNCNKEICEISKKVSLSRICLWIGSLFGVSIGLILKNIFLTFLFGACFFLVFFLVYKKCNSRLLELNKESIDLENSFNRVSCEIKTIEDSVKKVLLDSDVSCNDGEYGHILEVIGKEILEHENHINNILTQYNCNNESDFESLCVKFKNKNLSLKKSQDMKYVIERLKNEFLVCLQKMFNGDINLSDYFLGCKKYSYICGKVKDLKDLENSVLNKSVIMSKDGFDINNIDNTITSTLDNIKKYECDDTYIDKNEVVRKLKVLEGEKLEENYYEIRSKINLVDEDIESLETLLKSKYSKLSSVKSYLKSLGIAKQVFEESVREIRKDVVPLLDLKASEIFSKLTDSKYDCIHIQKDYTIFVGDNISYTCLSNGTIDQAYLSLRIAMSEIISGGSYVPFFMDDVLMQYDDCRLRTALKFLKDYFSREEKRSQVVIFTCHDNILEFAKGYNCNIVYI